MGTTLYCSCASPATSPPSLLVRRRSGGTGWAVFSPSMKSVKGPSLVVRASIVDSHESSSDFAKRMEQAWLISQQPGPVACSSCESNGYVECKWCRGTGFFILGNNLLCEVPSRNTTCVICAGKGSACCPDCKGTGFRAKWLGDPPPPPPPPSHQ
ncbi:Heat shock protein DnaJ cysteine-rich domain-containing protein [Dioscorea alata]|uniref:Heat shock protein DnaJ cysteine-rich domain-containing protein n=1 Tax=Dioscorea alata TaxID=55571 RepID=A0ACB7WJE9_DIOAL|nr:Heat shock protein DnaJ cysteine-rich domain-containing protein [Dioscorea alata]